MFDSHKVFNIQQKSNLDKVRRNHMKFSKMPPSVNFQRTQEL